MAESAGPIEFPAEAARRRRWAILAVVAAAEFVCLLDTTVVSIALPRLASELHIAATTRPWIFDAYTLIFGSLLLLGGRAADLLGRQRVFLCGIALFTLASLGCGLAPSGAALLAARVAQGMGAAMLSPAALSILATTFPGGRERHIAMGVWSGLGSLGATIGVAFGGLVVELWGWPWVFYVNLPVGLAAFLAGLRLLPPPGAGATFDWRQADLPGALAATGGLLLTVYGVIATRAQGWTSWTTLAGAGGAAVFLALFWRFENRASAPLLPARLALLPSLRKGGIGQFLTGAVQLSVMFLVSLDVQQVLGLNPFEAGLSFVPIGAVATLAAVAGAPAIDRLGVGTVYRLGALLGVAGLLALAWQCDRGLSLWAILAPTLLIAVSLPSTSTTTTLIGLSRVSDRDAGVAAGLLNVYFEIGAALGVAVTATAAVDGLLYGYLAVAAMAALNLAAAAMPTREI
ncbi:MAG TPA: MFS transporter [Stellaceae bacterium]|nr:MFS transporter [Stellaceae bacterium]